MQQDDGESVTRSVLFLADVEHVCLDYSYGWHTLWLDPSNLHCSWRSRYRRPTDDTRRSQELSSTLAHR